MSPTPIRIWFDFVDPLSYLMFETLRTHSEDTSTVPTEWLGFELRPPPYPLTLSDDPIWVARREAAHEGAVALGVTLTTPRLIPWTRKAHELHLLAASHSKQAEVRRAVFEAFFCHGLDIGRVDVLVDIASSVGLDRTETKAALDVDRYEGEIAAVRREAVAAGVTDVPRHSLDGRVVEGFPDPTDLGTLLPDE